MTAPVRTLVVDDEPLARAHLRALLTARGDIEIVGECGDGRSAVAAIQERAPQLVLLDIQMPELDGLGVIREVGAEAMPAVVFVTAYDEHALEAFELHAFDYILKPVNRERFTRALDRVVGLVRSEGGDVEQPRPSLDALIDALRPDREALERLAVRVDGRVMFLRVVEIDWIEAADDQVRIHVGKNVVVHRATMAHLEDRLPARKFMRVHRSVLVNIERIREIQPWFQGDWMIVLADGTRVQSGKSYRSRVKEFIERQS